MATLEKITSLAKRRGFIYPGSEIYGGLKNVFENLFLLLMCDTIKLLTPPALGFQRQGFIAKNMNILKKLKFFNKRSGANVSRSGFWTEIFRPNYFKAVFIAAPLLLALVSLLSVVSEEVNYYLRFTVVFLFTLMYPNILVTSFLIKFFGFNPERVSFIFPFLVMLLLALVDIFIFVVIIGLIENVLHFLTGAKFKEKTLFLKGRWLFVIFAVGFFVLAGYCSLISLGFYYYGHS